MANEKIDILVIGGGEAGKYLAWTMAKAGRRAVVVERKLIGGSCPNIACLPSKNIIHSAKVANLVRHAADFGVSTGTVTIDMGGVRARKRGMVEGLIALNGGNYEKSGTELVLGEARFIAPKTVEVKKKDGTTVVLSGDHVFLNTGTHSAMADTPGLEASQPMTHIEALELGRLPEHLVVLGGGFIGLEFAQAMRRFGSKVTMLVRESQIARTEDADVAEELLRVFQSEGIDVLLNTELLKVEGVSGNGVRLHIQGPDGEGIVHASDILVATGRIPNTKGLGLENTGVEIDGRGYIRVNDRLETTAPNIWAMGDCAGSPHFTHVAFDDFRIVHENLLGANRSTKDRLVPFCLFTDPELARVGLNESEARSRGIPYRVAKLPAASVLRTRTLGETQGFLKALISTASDQILGFTALVPQAGELMAVVQAAMLGKLPYTVLREAIFTHPTMAEGLIFLFSAVPAK